MPPAISTPCRRMSLAIAAVAAVLAAVPFNTVRAERETDPVALRQLSDQFTKKLQSRQNTLYRSLLNSTDPVQQALNRNPNIKLMYVRENGMPVYYEMSNENAAKTIRTWDCWPGGVGGGSYSLTGSGTANNELALWDGGAVLTTHQEFGGRVTQVDAVATHFHSTHVAGTMIAGGFQAAARGMSYQANLSAYEWTNDTAEMAAAAAAGLQVSNHSYGLIAGWYNDSVYGWMWFGDVSVSTVEDYGFGFYDASARDWDVVAHNAPNYLICVAAGNDRDDNGPAPGSAHWHWDGNLGSWVNSNDIHGGDGQAGGYDCISWTANAKNALAVGAVNDIPLGYSVPGDVVQTTFSSWGPCDDGRIKPDIVANGFGLYGPTNTGNANYITIGGTSMATPNASGSINLLAGRFEAEFAKSPRSATLKALVINTADEAGASTGPDYANGWGLMNTKRAVDVLSAHGDAAMGLFEASLANGATDTYYFTVTAPQDVRLTIAWTDPAGTSPAASLDPATAMLVNDLDLRITNVGTALTTMPWRLDRLNPAAAAVRADNPVDNVEQIDIAFASAGTYRVTVGHKGALSGGSQDYSMVWRGMVATQPEETALGLHSIVDLAAPDFPATKIGTDQNQDRGVFITAIEDYQLSAIAFKIALPCEQTITARLYAANGTSRGAMLASGTLDITHPGHVFHYVPVNYQLDACKEYELVMEWGSNVVSWPWWSEWAGDPPSINEPYDAGGAIRVHDGSYNGQAGNYALGNFAIQGISNPTLSYTDLSPTPGAWGNVNDASVARGIYVVPERTVSLDIVNFASGLAAFQTATYKVRVFDGTGLTRGALLAEGYKKFTNGASTAVSMRAIPVNIVLEEGKMYDIDVQFPSFSTWEGQSEGGITLPFVNGPFRVVDGEYVGNPGNSYIAHFELVWTEDAGGVPHDLTKAGAADGWVDQDDYDYGMYVTAMINQEVYSLGWMADVPAGAVIGMNIYEATGTTRGALISSGEILSSGSGLRWHDVPVAASLVAGQDYDFEINITQVDRWDYWSDLNGGMPYTAYGVIQVRDSESGGVATNWALPQMRINLCNVTATPVLSGPTNVPKFTLAAPYPNPVSSTATLDFSLDRAEPVTINVYDVAGRRVATILNSQNRGVGPGSVQFDAKDFASGVYFLKMQTPTKSVSRKITVLK